MRSISKPWPPQDVSPDDQAACSFVDAERGFLASLATAPNSKRHARAEFNLLEKPKLRSVLYTEQHSLCIYCERRVEEPGPRSRNWGTPNVEHWRPLRSSPELALRWENLYLSCPTRDTCDHAKGARPLRWDDSSPELPWPTQRKYERLLGFGSDGTIYVRADAQMDDDERRSLRLALDDQSESGRVLRAILALNHHALVAARKAALDAEQHRFEAAFRGKTATSADRERWAQNLLDQRPRPPFVSIRVAWLRKALGRGRSTE